MHDAAHREQQRGDDRDLILEMFTSQSSRSLGGSM